MRNEIFNENNIYPHGEKFKEHFKDFYDSVFVSYLPFFKVENYLSKKNNYSSSEKITFEEAKKTIEVLKNIQNPNADIYNSNEDYPTSIEIYNNGEKVKWETIINQAKLKDASELNKALGTSIGALRKVFKKPELCEKLSSYTTENSIWHPTENYFDIFSKKAIYETFKLFNKNEIEIIDEFYENKILINLNELTEYEFIEKVDFNDYYIYSLDKEILFTIAFDSFYFLIATDKNKMEIIISENLFEGFLSNSETSDDWDYVPEELEKLLKIEKSQEENLIPKKWWQF